MCTAVNHGTINTNYYFTNQATKCTGVSGHHTPISIMRLAHQIHVAEHELVFH